MNLGENMSFACSLATKILYDVSEISVKKLRTHKSDEV
jgi:hypothetical protein